MKVRRVPESLQMYLKVWKKYTKVSENMQKYIKVRKTKYLKVPKSTEK